MSILPKYSHIHEALLDLSGKVPQIPNSKLVETLQRLDRDLSTSEAADALIDSTHTFTGRLSRVNEVFDAVLDRLGEAARGASSALASDLEGLKTPWKTRRTNYISLLKETREVAALASAAVDIYTQGLALTLSDDRIPLSDKKAEIKSFVDLISKDADRGTHAKRAWSRFQLDIDAALTDWQKIVAKHKLDVSTSASYEDINKSVNDYFFTFENIRDVTVNFGTFSKITTGSTFVSLELNQICPAFWLQHLMGALTNVGAISHELGTQAQDEIEELVVGMEDTTLKRAEAALKLSPVKGLNAAVGLSEDAIVKVNERSTSITEVWRDLVSDVHELEKLLEASESNSGAEKSLVRSRVETSETLWTTLGKALREVHDTLDPLV